MKDFDKIYQNIVFFNMWFHISILQWMICNNHEQDFVKHVVSINVLCNDDVGYILEIS